MKPDCLIRDEALDYLRAQNPWPATMPALDPNVHGWTTHTELMRRLRPGAKVIVEVGAWVGKGTLALLRDFPEATIITIDHWKGSREHQEGQGFYHPDVRILFERWCRNVWDHRARVIPIRKDSVTGLLYLKAPIGAHVDICYIDAAHDYDQVTKDILGAIRLVGHGASAGLICGDDFEVARAPNQVRRAVEDTGYHEGRKVFNAGRFWWLGEEPRTPPDAA